MPKEYYAHSIEGKPRKDWQKLEDHLKNVGDRAGQFADCFGSRSWGEMAGKHHDLGKGVAEWQAWLRRVNNVTDEFAPFYSGHVNHAIHGAKWLYHFSQETGKLLSYCIAGHHGGLPNWSGTEQAALKSRLNYEIPRIPIAKGKPDFNETFPFDVSEPLRFGYQVQFFIRMIFSCLVDADYLDTEKALDKTRSKFRSGYIPLIDLYSKFWKVFSQMRMSASKSHVNAQREIVLDDCLKASTLKPGLFSLTVPTGGGKTLSSLAFALEHAKFFKKSKIIYVIPFTSIIEQNASVFREILGEDAVLEHHCNFIPDDSDWKTRLASENWDAPIIVTTNVQFFNSFYANKPSRCRKLHNVANSIVIFDEVQTIPVEKLRPCLEVLKELTLNYGVSAILCTATQPAISHSEHFPAGLSDITEIINDVPGLFRKLKRTTETFIGEIDETELAGRLSTYNQFLCIVNTRQQALDLIHMLPDDESSFHLSALMYPLHRTRVLNKIRFRLKENLPCRVVSTQLIEAGVDVDFPVVFRMIAGMDSIAQAAGRCNREGKNDKGHVFIFKLKNCIPHGFFRQTAQTTEQLFEKFVGQFLEPNCIHEYFLNYYWINEDRMDSEGIVALCNTGYKGNIQFKDIALFQMIKTATIPIIVALEDEAVDLVNQLDFIEHGAFVLRKLQQYSVQIYNYQMDELNGWLETPKPGVFVLRSPERYSEKSGLICKPPEGEAFFG
jgi:CRISPR-associated endonuclease/helicase Cas3